MNNTATVQAQNVKKEQISFFPDFGGELRVEGNKDSISGLEPRYMNDFGRDKLYAYVMPEEHPLYAAISKGVFLEQIFCRYDALLKSDLKLIPHKREKARKYKWGMTHIPYTYRAKKKHIFATKEEAERAITEDLAQLAKILIAELIDRRDRLEKI